MSHVSKLSLRPGTCSRLCSRDRSRIRTGSRRASARTVPRQHVATLSVATLSVAILLVATWVGLPGVVPPIYAQDDSRVPTPTAPAFEAESRVVAVDAMVSVKRGSGGTWLRGDVTPKQVEADRLEVHAGDLARRIVAIEPAPGKAEENQEPWTIVLWFDAAFSNSTSLRWAATYLGEAAESLTALGSVEVLLAEGMGLDAIPGSPLTRDIVRQVVPPTRDAQELADALSRMAIEGTPGSDSVRRLRAEFLTVAEREPELAEALAAHAAELEHTLVRDRHDLLLASLLERGTDGPRRAVFWVTDGWDATPDTFYQHELEADRSTADTAKAGSNDPLQPTPVDAQVSAGSDTFHPDNHHTDPPTQAAAQTLAAYGWLTYPLLAPLPPPPPPGFYIGKWFFRTPSLKPQKGTPIPTLPGLIGTRKKYLDPERARAFLALGQALIGQDKIDDAIEAFEKSIFHFQNDKRTQGEQAEAWAKLGEAFGRAGRTEAKLRAFERVAQLDPERAALLGGVARVLAPAGPLTTLARTTSGFLIQDDNALRRALDDLRWRMRLTLELAGAPLGDLLPLTITHRGRLHITAPAWARSATPPAIAALHARRLLDEPLDAAELGGGELGADWPIALSVETDAQGARVVHVEVDLERLPNADMASPPTRYFRPTLALRAAEGAPFPPTIIRHESVARWPPSESGSAETTTATATIPAVGTGNPGVWRGAFPLDEIAAELEASEDGPLMLAVILDELDSGTWGGSSVIVEETH